MAALGRWNVRIIDYLIERGVDPNVHDKFGFSAREKAKIKGLRTIHSMLDQYERQYNFNQHLKNNPQSSNPLRIG